MFNQIETGMVASGKAVEARGRDADANFDEYRETFKANEETSTALVFAAENKDLESEATFNTN